MISNNIDKQETSYRKLFYIENYLRVAMHNSLVKKFGADYFNNEVFPPYEYISITGPNKKIDVVERTRNIKSYEKKYNLTLGYEYPYLWYLDFSILISMLDVYQSYFLQIFINKKIMTEIIGRLNNLCSSRNAIAHNRFISIIDASDIDGTYNVVKASINEKYIANFNNIALNPMETIVEEFRDASHKLRVKIDAGEYIDKQNIDNYKSGFSAILSIVSNKDLSLFNTFLNLLSEYNKLSRKPGLYNNIRKFVETTDILVLVSRLEKISNGGQYDP